MREEIRERLLEWKMVLTESRLKKRLCAGALAGVFLFAAAFVLPLGGNPVYAAETELTDENAGAADGAAGTEAAKPEISGTEGVDTDTAGAEDTDTVEYNVVDDSVIDDAGLFNADEFAELNAGILLLEAESGWNVYAVTTADAQGKTAPAYADDFFDEHSPEQEDGLVLLIDMDNREITISTCGEAIRYLTDERIDQILDAAYTDISNGYYGDCMMTMLEGVMDAYSMGIRSDQHIYDTETGEISVYRALEPMEALIALAAALACGIIFYAFVTGKYRLNFGTYRYEFRENGHVSLRVKEDRFINQTLTHRRIPKQTSSGGGSGSSGRSSVHRSSSGRSHGGGSRKF